MILTKIDRKLLTYLYHNSRKSYSKIAKECNLSRTQVEYNIKKYINIGLIKKFATIFDYNKFESKQSIFIFINLKKLSQKNEFLKLIPKNIMLTYGNVLTKFDLYLNLIIGKDESSQKVLSNIFFNEYVESFKLYEPFKIELYPLKFLGEKYSSLNFSLNKETETIKLDESDKKILKILKDNAREKIINIAKKTKISSELILYKIKRLQNNKVILGSKIVFNMKKIGFFYSVLLINIKNLSEKNILKLETFARTEKFTNSFALMNNKPNCFIQIFYKDEKDLRKTIINLKNEFSEEEIIIDLIQIEEEEFSNTLPFI